MMRYNSLSSISNGEPMPRQLDEKDLLHKEPHTGAIRTDHRRNPIALLDHLLEAVS